MRYGWRGRSGDSAGVLAVMDVLRSSMVGLQCLDCYFMVDSYFVYSLATQKSNRRFSDLDDKPRSSPSTSAVEGGVL